MSVCTTPRDLCANDEARRDARHELHKALDFGDANDRAAWVAKWSDALSALLAEPVADEDPVSLHDLEEAEDQALAAERELEELRAAASKHVADMDRVMDGAPDELVDKVEALVSTLEAAL